MRLIGVFTGRGFDPSTSEGRARERNRRAALSGTAAIGARGLSMILSLVSVPIALTYLGAEQYGVWVTILSFTTLLQFADFGLGNGLLNAVASSEALGDHDRSSRYISAAIAGLLTAGLVLGVIFTILFRTIDWGSALGISSPSIASEGRTAVAVAVACLLAALPTGVVQKVESARQQAFINSLWVMGGHVMAFLGLLLVVYTEAGLVWLVAVTCLAPVLVAIGNGVQLFGWQAPALRPSIKSVELSEVKELIGAGLLFFIVQTAIVVAYSTDNLVIANILGADEVTRYSIPFRLFMIVPTLLGTLLVPLWPAYREAFARGDLPWVRKTLRRTLIASALVTAAVSLFLVAAGPWIIEVWVGDDIDPSLPLLVGLSVWSILNVTTAAAAMLLNAAGRIGFQAAVSASMACANVALSVALVSSVGVEGAIWGTVLSVLVFIAIPYAIVVPRVLRGAVRPL